MNKKMLLGILCFGGAVWAVAMSITLLYFYVAVSNFFNSSLPWDRDLLNFIVLGIIGILGYFIWFGWIFKYFNKRYILEGRKFWWLSLCVHVGYFCFLCLMLRIDKYPDLFTAIPTILWSLFCVIVSWYFLKEK